jgi:hemerythrin-like domain-containing protein
MFAVHTMFRREFSLMPTLVRAVVANNTPRIAVVGDHVALVSSVLRLHHQAEDEHVWPLLRQCHDGEVASLIDVMEEQHRAVQDGLLQVTGALYGWRESGSAEAREALVGAIDQLLPVMDEHLDDEEQRVVPLIEECLTASEWGRVAQEATAETPPDKLPTAFGMLMYESDPAVIDMVVAQMPAEVQPVIKDVASQAYAAHAKELYGTATPPRAMS